MAKFHKIEVKSIYKEALDCSVIEFAVPEHLQKDFSFFQGQYLTLKADINGEDIRRSYSLCSSPMENQWKVAVKKIDGGRFSTFANETLKKGDFLEVLPPDGNFFVEVDASKPKNYIAFAAGSGITPVLSIIKTHLAQEPESTFQLFYANKETKSILFKNDLVALKLQYGDRFHVFHFLTKEHSENKLFNGRFSKERIHEIASKFFNISTINDCFLCGPEEMIFLIKEELTNLGLDKNNIHFELFEALKKEEAEKPIDFVANAEVTIIVDDEEYTFDVPGGKTILETAENNDADVPFSCKGGVCCTCKAKVLEGTVEMKLNYSLDHDDLANNLVLTCQALPTSKKVILDYDDVY